MQTLQKDGITRYRSSLKNYIKYYRWFRFPLRDSNIFPGDCSTGGIQKSFQGFIFPLEGFRYPFQGAYNSTEGIQISFLGVYNSTGRIQITFQGVYNSTGGIQISFLGVYNSIGRIQISFLGVYYSTRGLRYLSKGFIIPLEGEGVTAIIKNVKNRNFPNAWVSGKFLKYPGI